MSFILFPTLYKLNKNGSVNQWTIEVDGDRYRTHYGKMGGVITVSEWTCAEAVNVGKKNEMSAYEEAEFLANAQHTKKMEKGYYPSLSSIHTPRFIAPMLAEKWGDRKDEVQYPVWVQPKLDGFRCLITSSGATTRNGKKWYTTSHIEKVLSKIFASRDIVLDGEIYNHEYRDNFSELESIARKTKPSKEDLLLADEKLQYHIYDICDKNTLQQDRMVILKELASELGDASGCIHFVESVLCHSEAEVETIYARFLEEGYEGAIVRQNGYYEHTKTSSLLKKKDFEDQEFEVVEIREGNGKAAGRAETVVCRNDVGAETFSATVKGKASFKEHIWLNRDKYLNKFATVSFFGRGAHGRPRFPRAVKFREGVGID